MAFEDVNKRSKTTTTLILTDASLSSLDITKPQTSLGTYSYHLGSENTQLKSGYRKNMVMSNNQMSKHSRTKDDFLQMYKNRKVIHAEPPKSTDSLQDQLDKFNIWKGLKTRSPSPSHAWLPDEQGIETEKQSIYHSSERRGYDRPASLKQARVPTRTHPLMSRSIHFPRSPPPQKMTNRAKGVTFYTTGDKTPETTPEPASKQQKSLVWQPKSYKNFFTPDVPPPKGMESNGGYVRGLLQ